MSTQVNTPTPKPDEYTLNLYYALHDAMAESYNKGDTDPEQYKHAEDAARSLITQVDLPLLIRCQALCVLGSSSNENDFLRYAEEAVHFAEVAVQQEGEPKDEGKKSDLDVANFMLESCQKILEGARKLKAQQEQEEQQEEQEQHEEQEQQEDFEVLWDPAWTDEHKARMKASCSAKPDEEKKWSIPWMDSRAPTRR